MTSMNMHAMQPQPTESSTPGKSITPSIGVVTTALNGLRTPSHTPTFPANCEYFPCGNYLHQYPAQSQDQSWTSPINHENYYPGENCRY